MKIDRSTSLGISNRLNQTSQAIARSLQRLSSGKSVSSARDGVAAYAQIQRLDSQVRGLSEANLSINQLKGLVDTGTTVLGSQIEILQQMRQIAVEASSALITSSTRSSLNEELISLRQELERQLQSAEFAGLELFNSDQDIEYFDGSSNSEINLDAIHSTDLFTKLVGAGEFEASQSAGGGSLVSGLGLIVADVNNDGREDFIASDSFGAVEVSLNQGEGVYQSLGTFELGTNLVSAEIQDVNGDGINDIFRMNSGGNGILVAFGNGDGTFQTAQTQSLTHDLNDRAILGDLDGDGDLDVLASSDTGDNFIIGLNDGQGNFSFSTSFSDEGATEFALGDLNGDGNLDILSATGEIPIGYYTFLGDGSGSFSVSGSVDSGTNTAGLPSLADLDGDGDLDFASRTVVGVDIGINDGNGNFSVTNVSTSLTSTDVRVGNFDDDDQLEILQIAGSGAARALYLIDVDGSGAASVTSTVSSVGTSTEFLSAFDYNGDGIDDILFTDLNGSGSDAVQLLLNQTSEVAAVSDVNVASSESAQELVDIIDQAIERVTSAQTDLAISSDILTRQQDFNLLISEDLTEAKNSIEGLDFALETANLVQSQILQQAQVAALTQANVQMQVALELLETLV